MYLIIGNIDPYIINILPLIGNTSTPQHIHNSFSIIKRNKLCGIGEYLSVTTIFPDASCLGYVSYLAYFNSEYYRRNLKFSRVPKELGINKKLIFIDNNAQYIQTMDDIKFLINMAHGPETYKSHIENYLNLQFGL